MTIPIVNGVNPLQTTLLELGIVSGRVALLLRSAEIQPVFGRFSMNGIRHSPSSPCTGFATGREAVWVLSGDKVPRPTTHLRYVVLL
jgi:hypothetical protein